MIHQRTKDIIFNVTYFITKLLRPYYSVKYRNKSNLHLHLGSGNNIIDGFINIDGNPFRKRAIYYDLRNRLPFENNSVQYIFISNVLEHFYPDEVEIVLKEIYRCMMDKGILRIVVPDLEKAINAYLSNDLKFFHDYPRCYKSLGGKFSNAMFCDAQHRLAFDFSYLSELLEESGFNSHKIIKAAYDVSNIPSEIYAKISPYELGFSEFDLFVEATK